MVAVVGVSESSKANLIARLNRLGTDLLTVQPGTGFLDPSQNDLPLRSPAMIGLIPPVRAVADTVSTTASVYRSDKIPPYLTGGITVLGADTHLTSALDIGLAHGTWLNTATANYPTVVLGHGAAQTLGIEHLNPADRRVARPAMVHRHRDPPARRPRPRTRPSGADRNPGRAPIPRNRHPPDDHLRPHRPQPNAGSPQRARANSQPREPSRRDRLAAIRRSQAEIDAKGAYNTLLLGLGAIALLVGAVGIANVMVMAIIQRRTEIGLRRALGATRRHIAIQFTAEALTLSALGGAAGIRRGILITAGYAHARHWSTTTPPAPLPGALAAALTFGLIAGLYPAIRAARLSPTDALRHTT